jgi:hypothetical protein
VENLPLKVWCSQGDGSVASKAEGYRKRAAAARWSKSLESSFSSSSSSVGRGAYSLGRLVSAAVLISTYPP